jgi:hypothetical protein
MEKIKIIDESGDKKYFTIIPNYILNHSTLWDREVYIQMKRITGEDGTCWTSQKTLSKQCGISINRLKKSLAYLIEHKWIKQIGKREIITKGGLQSVNEYKVADLWKKNIDFYETKGVLPDDIPIRKGVSPDEQRGVTVETKGVSPDDDKEEPSENKNQLKNTATQSVAGSKVNDFIYLFKEVNPSYERLFYHKTERGAMLRLLEKYGENKVSEIIQYVSTIITQPYAPRITTPYELEKNLGKVFAFYNQEKNKKINIIL